MPTAPMSVTPAISTNTVYVLAALAILLSRPVTAFSADLPTIQATPNPAPVNGKDEAGTTTISWQSQSADAQVFLSACGGPEKLFSAGAKGERTAPWIRLGGVYEFRLYQGHDHSRPVSTVTVTGILVPDRSNRPVGLFASTERGYGALAFGLFLATIAIFARAFWPRRKAADGSRLPTTSIRDRLMVLGPPLIVLVIAGSVALINLWWLARFRGDFPMDIDESQFIVAGFDQASALQDRGLEGFWDEFQGERWHGPLQPLVTCLLTLALGRDIFLGFVVVQLFLVLLIFVTYGIGKHLGGPSVGVLSALVVGSAPGVLYASRVLFCTIPSSALLALATYSLLKSRKLDSLGWTVLFGLTVGLANLSRPLAIFLSPGLFVAALFQIVTVPQSRRRRVVHWLLSGMVAFIVSEIWYYNNFGYVWHYLTDYGFGRASLFEGEGTPPVIIGFLTYRIRTILNQGFQVPLALILAGLGITGLIMVVRRLYGEGGWRKLCRVITQSDFTVVAIITASIYSILSMSRNEGDGFMIFIVPTVIVMSVTLAWAARNFRLRGTTIGLLVLSAAFNTLLMADLSDSLSVRRTAMVPWVGYVFTVDGWGSVHSLAWQAGYQGPVTTIPPLYRQWCIVNDEILESIEKHAGGDLTDVYVIFCLRDPLLNFATLKTFNRIHFAGQAWMCVHDAPSDETLEAYRAILERYNAADRAYFVSAPPGLFEYGPIFNQGLAEKAAPSLGFKVVQVIPLPDGRNLRIWERKDKASFKKKP